MTEQQLIPHTIPLLPGLPGYLAGRAVDFDLPRALRLRLRHPEKIRVSEWAEKYRIVSDGAHEGPWRHEYAPHTVRIMDTFGQPWVREVWFCGVEQSGKTNTMINCIGWCIDCDPGGIFYLMPTEDTADKITGDVPKVVEVTAKRLGLNETEGKSVLRHLIEGGDLSRFGMFNAITRMSADVESYDRASELEVIGPQVIELAKDDWKVLAEAA